MRTAGSVARAKGDVTRAAAAGVLSASISPSKSPMASSATSSISVSISVASAVGPLVESAAGTAAGVAPGALGDAVGIAANVAVLSAATVAWGVAVAGVATAAPLAGSLASPSVGSPPIGSPAAWALGETVGVPAASAVEAGGVGLVWATRAGWVWVAARRGSAVDGLSRTATMMTMTRAANRRVEMAAEIKRNDDEDTTLFLRALARTCVMCRSKAVRPVICLAIYQ